MKDEFSSPTFLLPTKTFNTKFSCHRIKGCRAALVSRLVVNENLKPMMLYRAISCPPHGFIRKLIFDDASSWTCMRDFSYLLHHFGISVSIANQESRHAKLLSPTYVELICLSPCQSK